MRMYPYPNGYILYCLYDNCGYLIMIVYTMPYDCFTMQAPKARAKIVTEYIVKYVDYENLVNR